MSRGVSRKQILSALLASVALGIAYYLVLTYNIEQIPQSGETYVSKNEYIRYVDVWKWIGLILVQAGCLFVLFRVVSLLPFSSSFIGIVKILLTGGLVVLLCFGYRFYGQYLFSQVQTGQITYHPLEKPPTPQGATWRAFVLGTCGYASVNDLQFPNDTTARLTSWTFQADRSVPLLFLSGDWKELPTTKRSYDMKGEIAHREWTNSDSLQIKVKMRLQRKNGKIIQANYRETVHNLECN